MTNIHHELDLLISKMEKDLQVYRSSALFFENLGLKQMQRCMALLECTNTSELEKLKMAKNWLQNPLESKDLISKSYCSPTLLFDLISKVH